MGQLALLGGEPVRTRSFSAWPLQTEHEVEAVCAVVRSGRWSRHLARHPRGAAPADSTTVWQVDLLEREIAAWIGVEHALAVNSGTSALTMILRALGLGPGDEVIVPGYASIAVATAVLENNAIPVFADIEAETYTISPNSVGRSVTPRTRAVIAFHLGGQLCDMDTLIPFLEPRGIAVVEDARHALGSRTADGRSAGTFGRAAAFSFGASGTLTAGEGGLIATSDDGIAESVRILHDHGLEMRSERPRHVALGMSSRMTELQAALLRAQLPHLSSLNERRAENVGYFLQAIELVGGLHPTARVAEGAAHTHHHVILRYDSREFHGATRDAFAKALVAEGIPCSAGYPEPIYASPLFHEQRFFTDRCPVNCPRVGRAVSFDRYTRTCPNAERAARVESIWLPHRVFLGDRADADDVLYAIHKIIEHAESLAHAAGEAPDL